MADERLMVEVDKLKPHPRNELIYGMNEDVSDLVALIDARGEIISPLVIKDDFTIISGHRRWKAAQELGYTAVPCEFASYDTEDEELADLILHNADRDKTLAQKAREGMTLEATFASEAFLRKIAALKQNRTDMGKLTTSEDVDSEEDTEKGLARDKVAKAVGISSGTKYDRIKRVLNRADELKNEGKDDDANLLLDTIDRSASAACNLLKVDIEKLTSEQREEIKAGKLSPRTFLPQKEDKAKDMKTIYAGAMDEVKAIEQSMKTLKGSIAHIESDKKRGTLRIQLEKQMGTIQSLMSELEKTKEPTPTSDKPKGKKK
jgi:ParB family chromosome partitioning protein